MAQNNFILNLIAGLQKIQSKRQIKADIKSLGDIYVKLIGNLNMTKTRQYIKKQLKGLNNMTFKITPTVNIKGVQTTVKQSINTAQKFVDKNKIRYSFDMDKEKLQNQLRNFAKENSKLFSSKEMTAKYDQLLNLTNVAKSKSELNALRKQLSAFKMELISTGNAGMTWGDKFKASIAHFAQYFSGASFIYAMTNQLRNAWTEAKTLDDSLVDLQKVTSEIADRDALYKYFDKTMSKAQELNVKVGDLIDAITEFKKLGWSLSDAEIGASWANILSNVGDVDIETAIGSIKTANASFDKIGGFGNDQLDKKLEAYVDLINNMSNKYSIDAQGLAESIRLSAGTLTEAHTSIEQAAVMFAKANEYFNDPSYLGNTAKIGSLRMRASTGDKSAVEELEEMGEEIDNLSGATSKLREKLLALTGVDIMKDDKTFKSYYDQLYEISQVIDQLDDTSRANVLETMFGKARAAGGAALLNGMKDSAKAYQDAINSAGSATEEYTTWLQSADAATQRFSNNLTQTYQNFINGNTVRDLANLGSALLGFANQFGIIEGTVKGFLALKIGTFLTNGTMAFLSATKQVEQYGKALQLVNSIPNGNLSQRYSNLKSIAQATESLTTAQLKQVLSSQTLTQQDRLRILQMRGLTREMALQQLNEFQLTQATNAQTTANVAQTVSTVSLKSAIIGLGHTIRGVIAANPFGAALMVISIGMSAVTSSLAKHNEKIEESRTQYEAIASEIESLNSELKVTQERMEELKNLGSLTFSDKEEYNNLVDINNELQRKIDLLELEQKVKNKEKNDAFIKAMRKDTQNNKEYWIDNDTGIVEKGNAIWAQIGGIYASNATEKDYIEQMFSERNSWLENLRNAETQEEKDRIQSQIDDIDSYLQKKSAEWRETSEGNDYITNPTTEDDKAVNEWLDYIADFQDRMAIAMGGDNAKTNTFNRVVDNWIFDETVQGLQDLGEEGQVTAEMLNDPKYDEFIDKLVFLGVIDSADNLEDIALAFNSIAISANSATDSIENFADTPEILSISSSIEQLSKQLEPQYSKLGDAYSKIFTENGFTRDNIDNSMLEGLRSTFTDIEKELGITFDTSLLNTFFDSLTDGTKSAEEVQQAFNDLATSYIYSTNVLDSLNEETADSVMLQLKQLGVKNAEEVITAQLSANERKLSAEKELLNKTGKDFATITYGEVNSLKAQNAVTEESVKNITLLAIQKQAASLSTISTSDDIENLYGLIYALSATGVACTKLKTLIDLLNSEEVMPEERKTNIINSIQEEINAIMKGEGVEIQIDFDGGSASENAKGTAQDITDMLEKELAVLDRAMEAGYLDFNDYINRRLGLIEDYYNKGKISADQYYSYLQKHYETELSYMDKVTNAVIRRLDKEKQSLEKQKESINERYQKEIDALEKRKSILQEEADNLQRQRDLEKALYDLRRAEEQRTQKIYTADKGFNYVADPNAIRDAQDDVATKKLQIEIAEIDKAIKKLEEARDKEVEAIDQRITKIEEYKEKWQQISEEFTQKQEDMIAAMVLGADWENDILNQRLDTLENFKDRYIALQQAIVDAAYQAAKAEKDASGATISDTSVGKGGGESPKGDNADKDNTSDSPDKDTPKNDKPKYFVLYKNPNTNQVSKISSFPTKEKAEEEAKRLNDSYYESIYRVEDSDGKGFYVHSKKEAESKAKEYGYRWYEEKRPKKDAYYVQKYHTGLDQGYVSKYRPISDDEKLKMFQKFSRSDLRPDEVPALLKAGELVMTQNQQDNILKNLQMTYALNSVPANNNQINYNVTINCPNVTNTSGAENIVKELKHLTLDALQYANKRY